jgi:hypothetical protein
VFDDDIVWQSVVLARRDLRLIAWALAAISCSALLQTGYIGQILMVGAPRRLEDRRASFLRRPFTQRTVRSHA